VRHANLTEVPSECALVEAATASQSCTHTPYSGYTAGKAVLAASGRIYGGCNIDDAIIGIATCAERVAIYNDLGRGAPKVVCVGLVADGPMPPCGGRRQLLMEFALDRLVMGKNLAGAVCPADSGELLSFDFSFQQRVMA
jgi:cytidine deaminase